MIQENSLTHTRAHAPNVLIACEESQVECLAFRRLGANAFSCDLQPCSGAHPEWHVMGDALRLLSTPVSFETMDGEKHVVSHWDFLIAHPPCTFLSKAASNILYAHHKIQVSRFIEGWKARYFFMKFYTASIPYIAVENPVPFRIFKLPRPSTYVQPWQFGHPWSKKTLLWLKNLPPLFPTLIMPRYRSYVRCSRGSKARSKSFQGIANAMAEQWMPIISSPLSGS